MTTNAWLLKEVQTSNSRINFKTSSAAPLIKDLYVYIYETAFRRLTQTTTKHFQLQIYMENVEFYH